MRTKSPDYSAQDAFTTLCAQQLGEKCIKEYRFHPTRRWRFDYAMVRLSIAVEVEGGIWIQGRHARPMGMQKDMEKYNMAASLGWCVLRTTPKGLMSQEFINLLSETIHKREHDMVNALANFRVASPHYEPSLFE